VRATPVEIFQDRAAVSGLVPVRNHDGEFMVPAHSLISTDFLQLVRFGLRTADDPIVRATLVLVDGMLRIDTPSGPSWYRYNGDGYGEHEDGRPYNGTGRGRLWPLLTGERGHLELSAGRNSEAKAMLRAMIAMSGRCGLVPEQVWDVAPIPEQNLFPGRPSGSAMPLVWAHAELVKLAASLRLGRPVDRPEPVWLRYNGTKPRPMRAHWSRRMPVGSMRSGQSLRLILGSPSLVHWSQDSWQSSNNVSTKANSLGLHLADLPTESLTAGQRITFSIKVLDSGNWVESDRVVAVVPNDA
jgi:glucoamylase